MVNIIGVKFKSSGKIYYFNPGEYQVEPKQHVIVETARGVEYGEVVIGNRQVEEDKIVAPLKDVIRISTEADDRRNEENKILEKDAAKVCIEKIKEHKLEMKLIDVEYTFDSNKILFYFTADKRIDFRELVRDLAAIYKTRIELRQEGVRDEARIIGGLGVCGRVLCCNSCMSDFLQPVSIKMAKDQGLSLSPTKISGACGRLMCCLKYEQEAYVDALSRVPGVGSVVETQKGRGDIVAIDLLHETVSVKIESSNETDIEVFPVSEIKIIKKVGGKAYNPAALADTGEDVVPDNWKEDK